REIGVCWRLARLGTGVESQKFHDCRHIERFVQPERNVVVDKGEGDCGRRRRERERRPAGYGIGDLAPWSRHRLEYGAEDHLAVCCQIIEAAGVLSSVCHYDQPIAVIVKLTRVASVFATISARRAAMQMRSAVRIWRARLPLASWA